jgi:hypothetical protein
MKKLLISVPKITNRLRYVFDLVLKDQLGLGFSFATKKEEFVQYEGPKFSYGEEAFKGTLFFKASNLLFEREISSQDLKVFDYEGTKAFFPVFNKVSALPFDVFAAIFYLVSRYEEYLPFVRDKHGRFEAGSSVLHEMGMLQTPLVNIWCQKLGQKLQDSFSDLALKKRKYQFVPTYDIDAAWAYKHKGFYRSVGAYMKDLIKFDKEEMKYRTKVLSSKRPDPFDTFSLQLELQKSYKLRPVYFILFAAYGLNDKNISVRNPHFRNLIKQLGDYAEIGIHPSYASFSDKKALRNEIAALSAVVNRQIIKSRQHFLRLSLPETYQNLVDLDITDDYTMGYAQQPGFRAGIADSFLFYDLDHDVPTNLRIHPFTVMDGTLRDYMQLSPQEAIEQIKALIKTVKSVDGTFISLWHNESLSNEKRWKGWLDVYLQLVQEAIGV